MSRRGGATVIGGVGRKIRSPSPDAHGDDDPAPHSSQEYVMRAASWRIGAWAFAVVALLGTGTAGARQAPNQDPPDQSQNEPSGPQVLTQGPIHEAFAEPVLFDPKPGPVVPKAPPAQLQELPPDQKPAGDNVQWIPGYWAWDDGRNDFIWISGVWRAIPAGRQYVPGYWQQVEGGSQWVPAYWASTDANQVQYQEGLEGLGVRPSFKFSKLETRSDPVRSSKPLRSRNLPFLASHVVPSVNDEFHTPIRGITYRELIVL
jgi:hypothetical protein